MPRNLSRRAFLKGGLAAACATAAAAAPSLAAETAGDEQLATLIEIERCIGCEECVYACREANSRKFPKPVKPFPKMYPSRVTVEDWSEKRDVADRLTPYNLVCIQQAEVVWGGETRTLTVPMRCMHCVNPPCVKLCSWGAAKQYKNGISRIDSDICLGGHLGNGRLFRGRTSVFRLESRGADTQRDCQGCPARRNHRVRRPHGSQKQPFLALFSVVRDLFELDPPWPCNGILVLRAVPPGFEEEMDSANTYRERTLEMFRMVAPGVMKIVV